MKQINFVRFGNLNPVKHKEHNRKDSYHTAPRRWGIYAFPEHFVERFLIGASYTDHWRIKIPEEYIIESIGVDVKYRKKHHLKLSHIYWKYNEDADMEYATYLKRPKKFQHKGEIWSHLENFVKPKDILDKHGDWIKTTMRVYIKALNRCNLYDRFQAYIKPFYGKTYGNPHTCPAHCTKDHYEVFIEHVK